ncbi:MULTISPECIES: lycopene beta-cyclase CrtY [unclassified Sphingopyxis]|uniref:lycopene beta-cyclase CrtY n=1 Tax=unclassified Sphingopyxis TaxID=2614943 RepID=UPI002857B831|nr:MULTISPECIES: lycopene beta-cyclase CrtY [unclassified Sphingopyxis]MDR7058527.1 lycopene beta-cyclase [Sphingopyxis sp. BE235]MDR7179287.1 lycopene beta-cyclase [Sphingopyxis sp. BE249]
MVGPSNDKCDIAIVGGGLAGGLAALALAAKRPDLDIRLVEPGPIGGNHIWSFFDSDIAKKDRWLVAPLVRHHWPHYDVRFPSHERRLRMGYKSITGEALADAVMAALPTGHVIVDKAKHVAPDHLLLSRGGRLSAKHVIDARGGGKFAGLDCGWQKFVGQALTVKGGHGVEQPVVMDATVEQLDGYRFVYLLPFDAETLFVEDTYYSDDADLDVGFVRERIAAYAAAQGWDVAATTREESGVLPVVIAGDFDRLWPASDRTARIGVRAGTFHATTGYSLPDAVRTASSLPGLVDRADLPAILRDRAAAAWRRQRFYRMLGAMAFRAADPGERYRIFERFYRLSPGLIARFYAGRSTTADKLRILSGRPPVPIGRAISALWKRDWR